MIIGLLEKKVFSDRGSTEFTKEQATYLLFKDLLDELEGIIIIVNLISDYYTLSFAYRWHCFI